jgi:hypothetical protein
MTGHPHRNKPISAVTGKETDAELRELIIKFTQRYSGCTSRQKCQIRSLSGLTFASLSNLVKEFNRDFCLDILKGPCACRERDSNGSGQTHKITTPAVTSPPQTAT